MPQGNFLVVWASSGQVERSVERCVGAIRLLMRLCVSGLFATSPVGNLRDPQTRVAILPFSLGASPIGVVAFLLLRGVAMGVAPPPAWAAASPAAAARVTAPSSVV